MNSKMPPFRAVPVKQEKIKSPDFRGEYGVTSVTPFLFASISLVGFAFFIILTILRWVEHSKKSCRFSKLLAVQ